VVLLPGLNTSCLLLLLLWPGHHGGVRGELQAGQRWESAAGLGLLWWWQGAWWADSAPGGRLEAA
jgi:hypothetical protein